jgi:hypothetical protein
MSISSSTTKGARIVIISIVLVACLASTIVTAQTASFPAPARAERQMQQTNGALLRQEQQLQQREQTQFDINQLQIQNQPKAAIGRGALPFCSINSIC